MNTIVHSAHMDIFQNLSVDLENEGRYLFLNAIANQLRYPNSHTHYFSCVLLYLFVEANSEAIQVRGEEGFNKEILFKYCYFFPGTNYSCFAGTSDCKSTPSMGLADHICRANQEPGLQILEPWLCPLCTRN